MGAPPRGPARRPPGRHRAPRPPDPSDVALVVEVADSSPAADLRTKARVYGHAGYATYWVVHRGGVEVLTEPDAAGYGRRDSFAPGDQVAAPYAPGHETAVDALLDAEH